MHNISSRTVTQALKENFARYRLPEKVISDNADNARQFTSRDFDRFAEEWGFEHVTSSPYYAQANGRSERALETVKNLIKKSLRSNSELHLN